MNKEQTQRELSKLIDEYGNYPYNFFNILQNSNNPNIDFETQNKEWQLVKDEEWHNLDLYNYLLWAISDNGDLLWWNGKQTVAMNPRASEFMSLPVGPKQFIRLIGMGKVTGIFPEGLWNKNA
ncbi:MAG: hypothetical protein ABW092_09250 [Candidatus Thiodiazotropha sp.]